MYPSETCLYSMLRIFRFTPIDISISGSLNCSIECYGMTIFSFVNGHLFLSDVQECNWFILKINVCFYLVDHFNFQYTRSCHLQIIAILFLAFWSLDILFLCLILLFWLKLFVQCRREMGIANVHILFPSLKKMLSIFHQVWCYGYLPVVSG